MTEKHRNIIFDLDGTLADTAPDIIGCLQQAIDNVLYLPDMKIDKSIIGPPVSEMIRKLLPDVSDEKVQVLTKSFRFCYDSCTFTNTQLYNGVREILGILRESGFSIFVVTNKPIIPTTKILKELSIDFFDDVICTDILPEQKLSKKEMLKYLMDKHSLIPGASLMVGDTRGDVDAANDCKIASVAVTYGYGNREDLAASKPDFTIENIKELITIIK